MTISIVAYNPDWSNEFVSIAASLELALEGLALRIDHIGSTAVPGLAAKDIIDIQITVSEFTPALEAALVSLGYEPRHDITTDHRPPGVAGPNSDWEKRYFQAPTDWRPTNVHVRIQGRPNQRYALLFRDYLRTHSIAAAAYGLVKQELARRHSHDRDAYYDIKDPVCDIIWGSAEEWAQIANWS